MACQRIHQWLVIILKAGVEMNFKQYKRLMERKTVITVNIKRAWLLQTSTEHVLGAAGETDSSPQLTGFLRFASRCYKFSPGITVTILQGNPGVVKSDLNIYQRAR